VAALGNKDAAHKTPEIDEWRVYVSKKDKPESADDLRPGRCDYDDAVDAGQISYDEALKREKVMEQETTNEKKRLEVSEMRGELIAKDEADKRMEDMAQEFVDAIGAVPQTFNDLIPADLRPKLAKLWEDWQTSVRSRLTN